MKESRSLRIPPRESAGHSTSAVHLLECMLTSQEMDLREGILVRQGRACLWVPSLGHEALAALASCLEPADYLFPHYRDRALLLARGLSPQQIARDFFARRDSTSAGRNQPSFHSSRALKVFGAIAPTAAACLPAVGVAWGLKQSGAPQVVLCDLGDAATRQGEFYEAVCLAVQERLPVVFVVEDNGYGISTPTQAMLPFRLEVFNDRLVTRINGRDPAAVLEQGRRLVGQARRGAGPSILWCELDRLGPHTNADDPRLYRTAADLDAMTRRDPVAALASRLIASGELTREAWAELRQQTHQKVERVYLQVEQEPAPDPAGVAKELFAPAVSHSPLPLSGDPAATMVTAINQALAAALGKYGHILLFGEDIEDPKGGVFGFTKGLSSRYPGRVVNSPLAEATIVGTAVGLAATGYKPVFEIQFIDFLTPAFHQLVAQVATLRWRTHGNWSCPLVLYAPYGAYLPAGGPWHSQSNEGWWTHTPGLRVAVPSTPADAAGLFWAAIEDEDPSLILIPKHLCRVRVPVEAYQVVPFGQAAVRRPGKDVTVVCWGNAVELAEQAAEQLAAEGVSAEVIDLRTLVPCDWPTVQESLARTGRLVVVQEDNRTGSFGASVIARLVTDAGSFYRLLAPPQLVSREDVHIPFHPDLESAVLPGVADVEAAVRCTLES